MKKTLFLSTLLLLTLQSYSQLTFTTKHPSITMTPGTAQKCEIVITNSGNHDLQISWRLISSQIQDFGDPNGAWDLSWCDCKTCSSNSFGTMRQADTCPDPMLSGSTLSWYVLIDPINPVYYDGNWIVEIFNQTDNIKDTLEYVFLGQPSPSSQLLFNSTTSSPQFISGRTQKSEIRFLNNWNHDVQLSWHVLSSSLMDYGNPNGAWNISFSACSNVHDNSQQELIKSDTCPSLMMSGDSATWALTIDPNSLPVTNASWQIEVYNLTDFSRDTLTYVFLNSPVSVKQIEKESLVFSYPNPANDKLIIQFNLKMVSNLTLSVYNILGELVHSNDLNSSNSQFELNTQLFKNGVYFYSVEGDEKTIASSSFIVQH